MIHVIGDIIIDEYWYGSSTRLSPEAPIPVVDLKKKRFSLGGAGNVYMNIKSATEDVMLYGYNDSVHSYILQKIKPQGKIYETNIMPHKTRVVANGQVISRIDHEQYIKDTVAEDDFNINNPYEVVVLSDYNKGTVKDPQNIISKSKRCIVDPKVDLSYYENAYILKPNQKEFEEYIDKSNLTPKQMLVEARRVREELNIENFIVTLGAEGVILIGDQIEHYPATARSVSDVTGAGDTFTAALAICCFMNMPVYQGVIVANLMAGEAVETSGTYMLNYNNLVHHIEETRNAAK